MNRLLRLTLAVLGLTGLLAATPAFAQNALSPAQRHEVDGLIHDYLMQHPEVILEAVQAHQARQQQEAEDQAKKTLQENRKEIFDDPNDLVLGNPKGDVTLVEFFDYRCPYCKKMVGPINALLKKDKGLRLVLKEYPILGPQSVFATEAALAARKQGKYKAFHEALMATPGQMDPETVRQVATETGIDVKELVKDIKDPSIPKIIRANFALGQALNLSGTPAFIIGDTIVPGAVDMATLERLVAQTRKAQEKAK